MKTQQKSPPGCMPDAPRRTRPSAYCLKIPVVAWGPPAGRD